MYITFTTRVAGAECFIQAILSIKVSCLYFVCSLISEPYDPPHNVTIANVTFSSVTLTWLPPKEPNGHIEHYSIYYIKNHTVIEKVRHK